MSIDIAALQNKAIAERRLEQLAHREPAVRAMLEDNAAKTARIAELEAALATKDAAPEADTEEQPDEPSKPKKPKRADA